MLKEKNHRLETLILRFSDKLSIIKQVLVDVVHEKGKRKLDRRTV